MRRTRAIGLIFGAVSIFLSDPAWAGGQNPPTVRVVLHDSSQASGELLAEASVFAVGVFRDAGIEFSIASEGQERVCRPGHSDHFCVQVLVRPRHPEFAPGKRPPMGVALAADRNRAVVSVYLDVVTEVALLYGLPVGKVLGIAIAHELGHVMLPPPSHSSAGIMQPSWDGDDLRQAAGGDVAFTNQQAALMRERLSNRP